MDELFSSDELARVQTAALMLGVSPQEFLRRATLALAWTLVPDASNTSLAPMKRGLTSTDL
jgi:hypothetical protein